VALASAPAQPQPKLATGTRPLPQEGVPASSRLPRGGSAAPLPTSVRPLAAVPESQPPPRESDGEEAATGTWASPLDGWDEPTRAYPPVRGT
jgi:hypothetical protein